MIWAGWLMDEDGRVYWYVCYPHRPDWASHPSYSTLRVYVT
jgi:hypothetical protein